MIIVLITLIDLYSLLHCIITALNRRLQKYFIHHPWFFFYNDYSILIDQGITKKIVEYMYNT